MGVGHQRRTAVVSMSLESKENDTLKLRSVKFQKWVYRRRESLSRKDYRGNLY